MYQPPKGTRDLGPDEMKKMNYVIDILREVFEKYGFRPLETPAFESFELLSAKGGGGDAIRDEIYVFKDKGDRELGLRFELTTGMVRFVTNNPDIPKPFKRYQIGRVWRYDNPQAMRYREFWQADIDIVGSASILADAECLAAFCEAMEQLGLNNFFIRINSRLLLESLFKKAGIKGDISEAFRSIDKEDKIGLAGVKSELEEKGMNPDKIINIIKMTGANDAVIKKVESGYGEVGGLAEVKELLAAAKDFGIDKFLKLDLSLVRGLDYYTGLVFELGFVGAGASCGGGGRYDKMVKMLGGPDMPATGISFGLSRLLTVMDEKGLFKDGKKSYFVVAINDSLRKDAIEVCDKLRELGLMAEMDVMGRKVGKQLEYASAAKFSYVVFVGPDELKKDSVKIRDMKTGKERAVKMKDLAKELKD